MAGKQTPESRVQEQQDKDDEQGFRGVKVDPTPNEAYTVAGVTAGAATPETDAKAAKAAADRQAELGADNSK